ncbi:unnamed protein product [Trifolium pratense]|uniref:Uncharacterized protein n=1 Tax=Trifolium pratense TaxID=57577 RepID=A0ACB0MF82_TRIPR|nr:unnamed protein product [Trifolium pratense]
MHNHELDKGLEGHLVAGRLKTQENEFLDEMTRNAVAPKNILSTLKERDLDNKTSANQVYNARHRYKAKLRVSMTEIQHLCKKLDDNKYFSKYRTVVEDGAEHLQDIFFAHPKSRKGTARQQVEDGRRVAGRRRFLLAVSSINLFSTSPPPKSTHHNHNHPIPQPQQQPHLQ